MTQEKANTDFEKLISENGFADTGVKSYDANTVYSRKWSREVEVVWNGKSEDVLEIKIWISYGIPMVWVIRNGRIEGKVRDYSSPKRAMNAIGEIVRCAGHTM